MKITEEYYKELIDQISGKLIASQGDFDFDTRKFSIETCIDFFKFRVEGSFTYVTEGDGYNLPLESWVTSIDIDALVAYVELYVDNYDVGEFIGVGRLVKDLNTELKRIDH